MELFEFLLECFLLLGFSGEEFVGVKGELCGREVVFFFENG